jgi:hypothetical protein
MSEDSNWDRSMALEPETSLSSSFSAQQQPHGKIQTKASSEDIFFGLKNISILNESTGNIIFQRVYKWNTSESFNTLHSMVQAFYQFARTCDDGGMVNHLFFSSSLPFD